MAYCKRCACGHVNVYEQMGGAPLRCTKCSRFIAAITEEVYVEQTQEQQNQEQSQDQTQEQTRETEQRQEPQTGETTQPQTGSQGFVITLESPEGDFVLPVTENITVGRNAAGMRYLEHYPDVSRQHFTIEPRLNGISATLTDISSWGTYVNGVRMMKGSSVAVSNSAELRLATKAILIVRVKEVNGND